MTDIPAQPNTNAAVDALNGTGIHEDTRQALEMMAYEGVALPIAADKWNIRPDNLMKSFSRPKVRRAYNQLVKAIRDNAAQAAYLRINHMSQTAKSEQVRLKANEWVAGVDGISKVQKVQGHHTHNVQFGGFDYPDLDPKPINVSPTGAVPDISSGGDDG